MERNVPKLRFKGFNDEWEEKKLGEIADVTKLAGFEFTKYVEYSDSGKIIALRGLNIKKGKLDLEDVKFIDNSDFSKLNRSKLYIGDLLLTYVGTIGELAIIDENDKYYLAPNVCRLRIINNNQYYIRSLMSSEKFYNKEILPSITTSSQPALSMENIRLLNIKVPSLEEQERIANFLTKVDKIIEKQDEKVKSLENYKKGMMQKIFSQEIRFKDEDGEEYPEWEDKKIGDIFIEINEKTSIKNQYEVLSSTSTGLFKQSEYFNREIASEDNTGYKILRKKQIVLSPQNLWLGNINYNNKYETGIVSPSYKIFNVAENTLPQFVAYIIKLDRMLYEYKQASEQGASVVRRNLNMDLFNDIVIKLPCYREQSRITAYLNNIDLILEKEKNKLEELKKWKKGLLQQMFV